MWGYQVIIHNIPQRSDEWFAIRAGKFTASDFGVLMPSSKQSVGEFNKTQMSIIYRVAAERMTGQAVGESYISKAMQHGIDTEEEARVAFMLETGLDVYEIGFAEYDEWVGCSPDGLIGEDSGLELKCPNSDTHLRYLNDHQDLLDDYRYQCVGGMLCTGRKSWHLYSYDARFPSDSLRAVHLVIKRDEAEIVALATRLARAIELVKEIMK